VHEIALPIDTPSAALDVQGGGALFGAGRLGPRNPGGIERAGHNYGEEDEACANEDISNHRRVLCSSLARIAVSRMPAETGSTELT
jgi:hypothetical protein